MNILLLDGGFGQELVARSGRATSLWSVQALLDAPDLVSAVHDDFFAAGADVATTDGYSIVPNRLAAHDLEHQLEDLTVLSVRLAADARDRAGAGIVAGSLGPIGFSYRPDLAPPPEEAAEIYARICRLQGDAVDVHIAETMASVDQTRGALMGMAVTGKPSWIALTVEDTDGTCLRSGEPLSDALPLLRAFAPERVFLNCSRPEAISEGLPILAEAGLPFGAYANGFAAIADEFDKVGATVDVLERRMDLSAERYADTAEAWIDMGASAVGGCCEISPSHIAEIARRLGRR